MNNGALKHICLWMILLVLFFLLLGGVYLFFSSRMEIRVEKKTSLVELAKKNIPVKRKVQLKAKDPQYSTELFPLQKEREVHGS